MRTVRSAAVLLGLVLALTGCGDGDDPTLTPETTPDTTPATASPDAADPTSVTGSVAITSPEDGAEVTSPVRVEATTEGVEIVPAGEPVENGGHLHVVVDEDCVTPGDAIPSDEDHIHLGDGSTLAEVELEPGEHTLCLQLGDTDHVATDLTDTVSVRVTE